MCGDGANDVSALKMAHVGISLSETESSVAAPFTSKEANITCVPHLIREGRGALVTSFAIFKYMAVYSLTQFVSVIILYTIGSNLTDLQFLYIDLFLITVFAFFFGNAEPYPGPLVKKAPSASLVSAPPIVSILCHMATVVGVQALAFFYVQQQPWFEPYKIVDNDYGSSENYTIFTVSAFQYIIIAIVFSRGRPYRKSLFHNPGLLSSLVILTIFTIYLVLWPAPFLKDWLELVIPSDFNFQLTLLGFALCHFLIALLIEYGLVDYILTQKLSQLNLRRNQKTSKREYIRIEYELSQRTDWPPISPPINQESRVFNETETIMTKNRRLSHPESGVRPNIQHVKSLSLSIPPPPDHPHHQQPSSPNEEHTRLSSSLQSSFSRPRPRSRHSSYSSSVEQNNIQNQLSPSQASPPTDIPT